MGRFLVRGAASLLLLGGYVMEKLKEAIRLRETGMLEESKELLIELVSQFPDSAEIQYHCAWTHDRLSLEREAAVYYEKALNLGLQPQDAEGAYIGLGSTYRTIGEYEKSKETLSKGLDTFPEHHAMKVFLAMTLYNLGESNKAMELLLTSLAATSKDPVIEKYQRAIRFYASRLDETW